MRLTDLSDNPGARRSSKRLGRGIGSGKGKTSGKGVKGQKARVGVAVKGFEGGQMPMHRRLPKRGFNQPNRARHVEISLERLQGAIDSGKLDASQKIDAAALKAAGLFKNTRDGVRLLAKGQLKAKCDLVLAGATAAAASAVEQAGGTLAVLEKKVHEPVSARGKARRTQPKSKKKAAAEE
jgi:large subunit ribosomal protein L15